VKILDVTPRLTSAPDRGSAVRIDALLRGLGRNHEVTQIVQSVVAEARPDGAQEYSESRFSSPLSDLSLELGQRGWTRAPILAGTELRLTYSSHNVEAEKFPSWAEAVGRPLSSPVSCRLVERLERPAVDRAELVLAVSKDDRDAFARRYRADRERIVVIPNGPIRLATAPLVHRRKSRPSGPSACPIGQRCSLPPRTRRRTSQGCDWSSDSPANVAGLRWVERLAGRSKLLTFLVTEASGHMLGATEASSRQGTSTTSASASVLPT
jgi:Glycosyl transferase 4-like domain